MPARSAAGTLDPRVNYTLQYCQIFQPLYGGLVAFRKAAGKGGSCLSCSNIGRGQQRARELSNQYLLNYDNELPALPVHPQWPGERHLVHSLGVGPEIHGICGFWPDLSTFEPAGMGGELHQGFTRGLGGAMLFSSIALVVLGPAPANADAATSSKPQSIWEWGTLTGDWGGHRTALKKKGIEFTINYIGEVMDVLSGGVRRGATYEGQLGVTVDVDFERLNGWKGTRAQAMVYQLHESDHRNVHDNVESLSDPSDIDALPTTRLFTAWLEQDLGEKSTFRIGQLAADSDFIIAPTAVALMNGTFGWPALDMADLPSGGPAYPLATPGARLSWKDKHWSFLTAIYSGNPAGSHCKTNPQACDRYGLTFSFSGGALIFAEARYAANEGDHDAGLAATYKLGGWYHTAEFPQPPFGNSAGDQVAPAATADAQRRGNWGIYAVADQMLWRAGSRDLRVFLRGQVVPADRNLVSWSVDGGLGIKGPFETRSDDTFTIGLAYNKISSDVIALDRELVAAGGTGPVRSGELTFEASYIAQISPWWSLQPDFQYIVRPGGGAADPAKPSASIPNAVVIGLRSTIKF